MAQDCFWFPTLLLESTRFPAAPGFANTDVMNVVLVVGGENRELRGRFAQWARTS